VPLGLHILVQFLRLFTLVHSANRASWSRNRAVQTPCPRLTVRNGSGTPLVRPL